MDFCQNDHPFYIAQRTSSQKIDHDNWFMKMQIGEKKLGGLIKAMAVDGGLDPDKRLTNHSTRKHLVQKLRDSGIADIMQTIGHKHIQSVMNYSAMSEDKHKECSKILSNSRSNSKSKPSSTVSFCEEPKPLDIPSVEPMISEFTVNSSQICLQQQTKTQNTSEMHNLPVPHPSSLLQTPSAPLMPSNPAHNSIAFVNDTVTLNTQMNSLFSGAVLNIKNFNFNMN